MNNSIKNCEQCNSNNLNIIRYPNIKKTSILFIISLGISYTIWFFILKDIPIVIGLITSIIYTILLKIYPYQYGYYCKKCKFNSYCKHSKYLLSIFTEVIINVFIGIFFIIFLKLVHI